MATANYDYLEAAYLCLVMALVKNNALNGIELSNELKRYTINGEVKFSESMIKKLHEMADAIETFPVQGTDGNIP